MICIVQRVLEAAVTVDGEVVGQIGPGLLVLAAVQRRDVAADVAWTAGKLTSLRIFPSADGTKNYDLDVRETGGEVLLVSNFTVAAATQKGRRPASTPRLIRVRGGRSSTSWPRRSARRV